jgi:hypothetical protein
VETVGEILRRLAAVDAERIELISSLRAMGFRSRGLVGEYGELVAEALYGATARRASASQPGYDLEVEGVGLVQVKTLRSTPANPRASMGVLREPYDALFALRLGVDYQPTVAWLIPRSAVEAVYSPGVRTSLTTTLLRQRGVQEIEASSLRNAAEIVAARDARAASTT